MRILVVTWAWPPIGRIGAMRPLGMAREWVAAGHEVHVLTGPGDRGGEYSPDLTAAAEQSGAVVHRAEAPGIVRPEALRAAHETPLGSLVAPRRVSRLRQILGQWKGFPDLQRSWIAPALALAADLHARSPFDVVWSTSPPESPHYVGSGLARRGAVWIADFRDQWSEYLLARWDPVSRFLIDRIAARVLAPAAAITANSEGVKESIARASGRSVECVRNGFDPPPPCGKPVEPRTLGYFGRVDPLMQHPERLWEPLRAVRRAGRPWRVDFHAAPGGGGGARIEPPAELAGDVRVLPPLPHPEALAKMQTMTALLILGWETRKGEAAVAGKLYEYIGSGRPALVCAPAEYEARRLVEASGTGLGAWSESEIVAALERLEGFSVSADARRGLARAACAAELLAVFAEARGKRA